MDIEKQLGVVRVKTHGHEMSFEQLTQKFDGQPATEAMATLCQGFAKGIIMEAIARGNAGAISYGEKESQCLDFLFRVSLALKQKGFSTGLSEGISAYEKFLYDGIVQPNEIDMEFDFDDDEEDY